MTPNTQTQVYTGLTVDDLLYTALLFFDKAQTALEGSPAKIIKAHEVMRDSLEQYKEGLRDDLYEAILDEGRECQDCPYCERDSGYTAGKGLTDEPQLECGLDAMRCPVVMEVMGK